MPTSTYHSLVGPSGFSGDGLLPEWVWWEWWWLENVWSDAITSGGPIITIPSGGGEGSFDCNRAVILCHPDTPLHPPACFLAKFPGGGGHPLKITGSGRISETVFTSEPDQYVDDPVIVYTREGVTRLMLPQELQSTGEDTFVVLMRTGLQATPGTDSHRLEAVELLLRRGAGVHPGAQEIMLAPVTSNLLDTASGSPKTAILVPGLNDASQPVKVPGGVFQAARFLGFTLFGTNIDCVFRYLGAILRGRRLS